MYVGFHFHFLTHAIRLCINKSV